MLIRKMIVKQLIIGCLITSFVGAYSKSTLIEKCKNDKYTECMNATYMYRSDNNNENLDWKYIEKTYLNLCKLSHAEACQALGRLYAVDNNAGVNHSWKKSAMFHQKGCQLNNAVSCKALGGMYMLGIFYKKDYKKALKFFTKGCDGGSDKACIYKKRTQKLITNKEDW